MRKELGIGIILVVLCSVVAILNPRFLSHTNLFNNANLIGQYGIYSIGLGLIIITGGIDLSVGSAFALQAVILSMMLFDWHVPWPLAIVLSLAMMAMLGLIHAIFITMLKLQPFIVTLCGLLIYRGLARFITDDTTRGFGGDKFPWLRELAAGSVGGVPVPFVALIVIAIIMWVVLHRSIYGRYLLAVGRNEDAARYSGINTKLVIGSAYIVSMILAGISGIMLSFYTVSISPSNFGSFYELYGIAGAVLGGCSLRGGEGSIIGIVLGTILLQVLQNVVNLLGIPTSLNFAVMGAVILIGVTVDQLLGSGARRRRKAGIIVSPPPPPPGVVHQHTPGSTLPLEPLEPTV